MINTAIDHQIQGLTDVTNGLLQNQYENTKNHSIEINQLIILSNLDLLQNQLETLEEAILLAKHGIPSSKLLSIHTFNQIATQLSHHDTYLSSFEELLSRSTAQVIFNVTHIAYVLKIPQLSQNIYEHDYIDSTIKNQKRIMIEQNFLLKNETHVFELTQPCEEQSDYYLCDSTSLSFTTDCIQQLIRGQHSNCNFEKVYSNGLIKRINDGTIFINDALADITSNCSNSNQKLNGTFLIQFEQCSLHINGELYSNFEVTIGGRPYLPTTGQLGKRNKHHRRPTTRIPKESHIGTSRKAKPNTSSNSLIKVETQPLRICWIIHNCNHNLNKRNLILSFKIFFHQNKA